jgi:hypothetical protein
MGWTVFVNDCHVMIYVSLAAILGRFGVGELRRAAGDLAWLKCYV